MFEILIIITIAAIVWLITSLIYRKTRIKLYKGRIMPKKNDENMNLLNQDHMFKFTGVYALSLIFIIIGSVACLANLYMIFLKVLPDTNFSHEPYNDELINIFIGCLHIFIGIGLYYIKSWALCMAFTVPITRTTCLLIFYFSGQYDYLAVLGPVIIDIVFIILLLQISKDYIIFAEENVYDQSKLFIKKRKPLLTLLLLIIVESLLFGIGFIMLGFPIVVWSPLIVFINLGLVLLFLKYDSTINKVKIRIK